MFKLFAATAVLILLAEAAPKPNGAQPLFTFDNGRVGVNFLGFKAAAGLGGGLGNNGAGGGLFAEAGTPFGQYAGAGLGGGIDNKGRSAGGMYAGARAGQGYLAQAGLGGYHY